MTTIQAAPCIFCGKDTKEQHTTSIGEVHIHSECLADLEYILSLTEEEQEGVIG